MRLLWVFASALLLALLPPLAVAQPACIPGIYGTTLDVNAPRRSDAGWRLVWLCQTPNGPQAESLACIHGVCVESTLRNAYIAATQSADPEASIKAAWAREVTSSCGGATGAMKVVCDEARADRADILARYLARVPPPAPEPPPPPAEVWTVAPNRSYPTRPTYAWDGTTRSTVAAAERVDVGAPCDPTVGADSYRGVLGRTDRVAVCIKQ